MKSVLKKIIAGILCLSVLTTVPMSSLPMATAQSAQAEGSTKIYALKTNNQDTPIGIEADNLSFSWKMESNIVGQTQKSYQITVNEGAPDGKEVWNTGVVESALSTGVLYKGSQLNLETRYYWTVTVTDVFGGTYSETTYFETGADWTGAEWIVNPDMPAIPTTVAGLAEKYPTPYFRTQKTLDKAVKAATLYITALGGYEAYINGEEVKVIKEDGTVLDDIFGPGWSDYYFYLNYQGYDVSSYIKGNEDLALAVQLNRAWHAGGISTRTDSPKRVTTDMALLAKLVITYEDGTKEVIKTDNTWNTFAGGPVLDNDFFNGVNYDARLEKEIYNVEGKDWNDVDFPMNDQWKSPRQPNWEQTYVNNEAWEPIHKDGYAGDLVANNANAVYVLDEKIHPVSGYTYNRDEIIQGQYKAEGTVWVGGESDLFYGEVVEHPVDVTKPISLKAGDRLILNLGQNHAGFNTLTVSGPEGTVIDMRHDERLNDGKSGPNGNTSSTGSSGPKGTLYWVGLTNGGQFTSACLNPSLTPAEGSDGVIDPWGPIGHQKKGVNTQGGKYPFSDRLVLAAGATEETPYTFTPKWTYHGYQYVEISATEDIVIHDLYANTITSTIERTGNIETNNKDVNRLFENNIWSNMTANISTPIDCPNRAERMGWTGDITIYSKTALYNFESAAFLENYQEIMATQARANAIQGNLASPGGYAPTTPTGAGRGLGMGWSSPWSDAIIMIVYQIYRATGDTRAVAKYFDDLNAYMDGFEEAGYTSGLGDWVSLGTRTQARFIGLAYKIYTNKMMIEMSEAIGETERATLYRTRLAKHQAVALLPEYRDPETDALYWRWGDANMETQTAYFWALLMEMYEDEEGKQDFVERMQNVVKNEGQQYHNGPEYTMTIGFAGINAALPALSNNGCNDLAYDLLLQDTYPSWLNHVKNGATTMWEQWNAYNEIDSYGDRGMNSFNHFAYGAVCEWFYTHMAGIEAGTPGYKEILLQPTIDTRTAPHGGSTEERINMVKGSYDSAYGDIVSNWTSDNGAMNAYEAVVPANTTATLYLPVEAKDVVVNTSGVTYVGDDIHNGQICAKFELAAGGYDFAIEDGIVTVNVKDGYVDDSSVVKSAIAPESAQVNAEFDVTVVTAASVADVRLFNANGLAIGHKAVEVADNEDGTKTWTIAVALGTVGDNRELKVVTKDASGILTDSGVSVSVNITSIPPLLNSFDVPDSDVANSTFIVKATTDMAATKIAVYNENGMKMGLKSLSYKIVDGQKEWTAVMSIGTKGERAFTAYAVNKFGAQSDALTDNISVKAFA
ncbi:MAG: family 78 glycoside hydrolase catalytic domain [Clostridiales bacterium]|nr:family 78 glycoside hydrolase catalytic domain [Clostridiales bacterium]